MKYLEKLQEYPEAFEYCLGAKSEEIRLIEKQLSVILPKKYKQFLSECGMCNFGDTRIDGIFKTENKTDFPVVENTLTMRLSSDLENDFIVLDIEEQEYLTLYKVSETEELEDNFVYGAEVHYENDKMIIGAKVKKFNSFDDFFNDFLELGKE